MAPKLLDEVMLALDVGKGASSQTEVVFRLPVGPDCVNGSFGSLGCCCLWSPRVWVGDPGATVTAG